MAPTRRRASSSTDGAGRSAASPERLASAVNLSLLGAGAWGTALAVQAAARHRVCLWTRKPAHAAALRAARENALYLPGVVLPPALAIEDDLQAALAHAANAKHGLVVIATYLWARR